MTTINQPKPVSISQVEMTELVLPEHTNALGTIFGGQIMAWIDIAAAICAFRHCRSYCVTASMDALSFLSPVKLGDIVTLKSSINYTGKTSMEVGVQVTAEDPLTGNKTHTSSAYLTFVAVDKEGKPREVPPLQLETDEQKRRFTEAKARKELRMAQKKKI